MNRQTLFEWMLERGINPSDDLFFASVWNDPAKHRLFFDEHCTMLDCACRHLFEMLCDEVSKS